MVDHNYRLKWNEFETNISKSFRELREDNDFFDVSLVCDDTHIQAHKLILSACSPFFKTILKGHAQHQHPLIYLRGIKGEELAQVLNFMYLGEVSVDQQDLSSFLLVAQDLKVKGLTKSKPDTSTTNNNIKQKLSKNLRPSSEQLSPTAPTPAVHPVQLAGHPKADHESSQPSVKKRRLQASPSLPQHQQQLQQEAVTNGDKNKCEDEDLKIKEELTLNGNRKSLNGFKDHLHQEEKELGIDDVLEDEEEYELGEWGVHDDDDDDEDEVDKGDWIVGDGVVGGGGGGNGQGGDKIELPADINIQDKKDMIKEYIMKHMNGVYQCLKCGYESSYNTTIKRHVEARHFTTPGVACNQCHVVCKTSNALTTHRSKFHHHK